MHTHVHTTERVSWNFSTIFAQFFMFFFLLPSAGLSLLLCNRRAIERVCMRVVVMLPPTANTSHPFMFQLSSDTLHECRAQQTAEDLRKRRITNGKEVLNFNLKNCFSAYPSATPSHSLLSSSSLS